MPPKSTKKISKPRPAPKAPGSTACRYYDRRQCGGCTQLHIPYEQQVLSKRQSIEALLKPLGVIEWKPFEASPDQQGWRTSVKLCLHEDRDGYKTVGLYQDDGFRVVSQQGCLVQHPLISRLANEFFQASRKGGLRYANHLDRVFSKRRLKYLVIRLGAPSAKGTPPNKASLGIIISHTGVDKADLLRVMRSLPLVESGAVSVYESRLNVSSGRALTGKYIDHLCGPETFPFKLMAETYPLTPGAFFQANQKMAEKLVSEVQGYLVKGGETLLDLYGGFGAYSIPLAEKFARFSVVDGNSHAIRTAQKAMLERAVTSGEAHATRCEDYLASLPAVPNLGSVTHVILNPPRGGLSETVIEALSPVRLPRLQRIVYVSCNPAALARDIARMRETWHQTSWDISSIRGFDMFPQTSHVEVVAVLDVRPKV